LAYYVESRAGGGGAEHLSWSKTSRLSRINDVVTLLTVLDGLGYRDAETLLTRMRGKSSRLFLDDFTVALAPVPTVTEFAKRALLTGVHPTCALDEEHIGTLERRDLGVIKALDGARVGDVVIWSLLGPDDTYHHAHMDPDSMRSEVDARLRSMADRIVRVAHETSDSIRLRLVITTDHGRLLSNAIRRQPVPEGMKAHGRAAWGQASMCFGAEGFVIEGHIAYLHPERFGVPETCAILLSDEAFLASDGRSGVEPYPHGGLYPEEVLIPWIELTRDREALSLAASLAGRARAGTSGTLRLEISNASDVRITALELAVRRIGKSFSLDIEVPPMGSATARLTASSWPSAAECEDLGAVLIYALPTGERRELAVTCAVESEEMYKQEDILSDL
jgi:hypothetical protein